MLNRGRGHEVNDNIRRSPFGKEKKGGDSFPSLSAACWTRNSERENDVELEDSYPPKAQGLPIRPVLDKFAAGVRTIGDPGSCGIQSGVKITIPQQIVNIDTEGQLPNAYVEILLEPEIDIVGILVSS